MSESQIKILIADDEPDIIELVKYNLEKEGFKVEAATDGKMAIDLAREFKPDVILLDIMMPKLDGVEVCRILREEAEFDQTIIAFLTARNEDFTQIAALDVGGDDFIAKPIRPRVLVSRLNALIRRNSRTIRESNTDKILNLGNISINKENFTIVKDGKSIDLAKKEFELLNLLVSKPGKVFTREEIYHKIWGSNVIVGNRTIDVHIRKLREKLGDKVIKTVKGIGYKIES